MFVLSNEKKQESKLDPVTDTESEDILTLSNLKYTDYFNNLYLFNFKIKNNSSNLIISSEEDQQNILVGLIGNIIQPDSGKIKFHNYNYIDYNAQELRNHLWIIDSSDIFSCTIYEYLTHGYDNLSDTEINNILELMSLKNMLYNLPDALQTNLIGNGFPLLYSHIVQLKITRAILHKPKLLIITDVLNKISHDTQLKILDYIKYRTKITFIHVSYIVSQSNIKYDNTLTLDRSFTKET